MPEPLLRALDLTIARRVDGLLPGDHRSSLLGRGSELAQIRPYEPVEDDVRQIDWNVTAPAGSSELASAPEQGRPVIAGKQAVDPARDRQVEGAQQRLGHRPRARAGGRLPAAEDPLDHAAFPERSSCGTGTAATISSSRLSGLRCSASAS